MDTSQQSESPTQTQNPFEELDQYPWDSDAEFQTGLSSILASNQSPELADDLTLRARCFYYARYALGFQGWKWSDLLQKNGHYSRLRGVQILETAEDVC